MYGIFFLSTRGDIHPYGGSYISVILGAYDVFYKDSLQNAWLTVYVYSSQTPLKQVDINLPVESGVIRMTAEAEVDENGEILFDTTRLTDLASSELVRKTAKLYRYPNLKTVTPLGHTDRSWIDYCM